MFTWLIVVIFACVPLARGGDVLKTNDTIVTGEIVAFDGKALTVQLSSDPTKRAAIPISEVVRVRLQNSTAETPDHSANGFVPYSAPGTFRGPTVGTLSDQFIRQPSGGPRVDVPQNNAPISLPTIWQLILSNGDVLSGSFRSWNDDKFVLEMQQGRAIVQIPIRQIHEIWRLSPELVRKARGLKVPLGNQDVAYVTKDTDIVAVQGTATGVENLALSFIYDGQARKINIDRLLGVVLVLPKSSTTAPATMPGGTGAIVRFPNGDQLTGQWTGIKDGFVALTTSWGQSILLPGTSIGSIEPRSGQIVYLSELKPIHVEQTPYFDRIIPWRADSALDGGPLRMNDGQQYAHGIAMHSRCVLEYDLAGQFEQFEARLGFEPLASGSPVGRVAVRASVDGLSKLDIPDLRSDQPPRNVKVDLHDGKRLTLEVDFGQDEDVNDRVVWANARLLRGE